MKFYHDGKTQPKIEDPCNAYARPKKSWESKEKANSVLSRMKKSKKDLITFKCQTCGYWHIGTYEAKDPRQIRKKPLNPTMEELLAWQAKERAKYNK